MVDNRLLLVAPISQMGALLAAVEGPASWSYPYGAHSDSFQPNFGPRILWVQDKATARLASRLVQTICFRVRVPNDIEDSLAILAKCPDNTRCI